MIVAKSLVVDGDVTYVTASFDEHSSLSEFSGTHAIEKVMPPDATTLTVHVWGPVPGYRFVAVMK
ncbi:MAG TPA: hypothetical protein VMX12_06390, partial [Acidimicrobiia bacterium]|nr:hypothetical protein [Acidimicrobiia bacterium]